MLLVLGLAVSPCCALIIDFESGIDDTAIGTNSGLNFSTIGGLDMVYYSVLNEDNMVKSDNGTESNEDWEYWISENNGAISKDENAALITFDQPMQYFRVGYSSYFPFVLEAYDSANQQVASDNGPYNSRYWDGTGLGYVDVSYSGISYVKLYADMGSSEEGGRWVIDNIRVDPVNNNVVPEWSSLALGLMALSGLGFRRRK